MGRIIFLLIAIFFSGTLQTVAQTRMFAVHPNVGSSMTLDEMKKYQLYPQFQKSAVDSITFWLKDNKSFFLRIHYSNGITEINSIKKKQVYYVHEKINVVDKAENELVFEKVVPVKIKKLYLNDTILPVLKSKRDSLLKSVPLFELAILVSETDFTTRSSYYLIQYHNYSDMIIIDRNHMMLDWDIKFTFIQPKSVSKPRVYFGIGFWIHRYNESRHWHPGAYGVVSTFHGSKHFLTVSETSFNLHSGMQLRWKRFGLKYGIQLNAGSVYSGRIRKTEYTITRVPPYDRLVYSFEPTKSSYFKEKSWNPSVNLNFSPSFCLTNHKKRNLIFQIENKFGCYFLDEIRMFWSLGFGFRFEF